METQDKYPVIIKKAEQQGEGKECRQSESAHQQSKQQRKNQQNPVSLLQQRLESQKQEHQKLKCHVGSLAADWKKQQQINKEQQEKLEALENSQKNLVEAFNQLARTMDEFLQAQKK